MDLITMFDSLKESLINTSFKQVIIDDVLKQAQKGIFPLKEIASLLKYKYYYAPNLILKAVNYNRQMFRSIIYFYAVSYISDFCVNNCSYCGHNCLMPQGRTILNDEEMRKDFSAILKYGPSDICILTGEDPNKTTPEYLIKAGNIALEEDKHHALETITYNVAPMSIENFKIIHQAFDKPLQYRLFQESYDERTYKSFHTEGPKSNFTYRLKSQERALEAGFDFVGLGTLLGLNSENNPYMNFGHDFEIFAIISHAYHIKEMYGSFPNSLSIPRVQKAPGSPFVVPNPVNDIQYILYHAILRIVLPETKLIITNRESNELRDLLRPFINIEDLAARPGVGGNYKSRSHFQNELGDNRTPSELIEDILIKGYSVYSKNS